MILGHHNILQRIDELFPKEKPYKIGAASADVSIGFTIQIEDQPVIDIRDHTEVNPWVLNPGQFALVAMLQHTVVPNDLSCLFLLKSTPARRGFGHAFSGWIDPGWDGILTMEIKNYNEMTHLAIWPGMPIGQLIYMPTQSAGVYKGRYQHSDGVVGPLEEIDYDAGS